ncbi:hypothetical protein B1R94_19460 [Mycolicibacterium litorale]|nr:hypothetical protein B1R94_19460 [Mycolicibacterium litorale]
MDKTTPEKCSQHFFGSAHYHLPQSPDDEEVTAISMNATTRPLDRATAPSAFSRGHRWMSAVLGALGIVVLAVLVAAVITMSHESSRPGEHAAPASPAPSSTVAVSTSAAAPAPPTPAPHPSWSATATASTLAVPPTQVPQRQEPSVRQRLHDMFPHLVPAQ